MSPAMYRTDPQADSRRLHRVHPRAGRRPASSSTPTATCSICVDDFIDIGVDILNPIQTSAGRMSNLPELKRRYGSRLSFCGAVDTQRVLPSGTPEEVRREVTRVLEVMAPGGGYLVASVHTIMDDVPPENILAMVDAVESAGPAQR
ncbi:MAG: hypothetical protein MZV65_01245 [Chromatiales bacterium]|nr:hypothetical protein [Chromatiales bacterium]